MKNIALFASGSGTNVENIITYFEDRNQTHRYLVLVNNLHAKIIEKAEKRGLEVFIFDKNDFTTGVVGQKLDSFTPNLIVLAGFLWKFPDDLVRKYSNKVINIHPALLPKYGGKGMYGVHVHEAVLLNQEKESGITVHFVNEHYDEGAILLQAKTVIPSHFTASDIAKAVLRLEHRYFPVVIDDLLSQDLNTL